MSEPIDNEQSYRQLLFYLKNFLQVRVHQYMTEILKIESLLNDPQSLSRKQT